MSRSQPTVLDLFCGAGGFSLGFTNAGYDVIAGVDTDDDALDTYDANHDAQAIQQDLAAMDPETFAVEYDIHPEDVDVIAGGPPCLPEGNYVMTEDGYIDISEVSVGTRVLTHEGRYKKVVDRGGKHYEGELIEIDLKYRSEPIQLTPEHPVLTADGWRDAGDLTTDDHIKFPKTPSHSIEKNEFTYETKVNQYTQKTQTLPLDSLWVWEFVGIYVAEGWRRKTDGDYEITLGVHEDDVEDVIEAINMAWGDTATWVEHTEGRSAKVTFCNEGVWKFLGQFGDGAWNKSLPKWMFELPTRWLDAFLDGYVGYDGSRSEDRIRYSSVSRELVEDVQRIWYRARNTLPSVRKCEHSGSSEINGREVERNDMYVGQVATSGVNHGCLGEDASHLFVPVSDVTTREFSGTVYNLEVKDDNSYCTHLASLHNCQGFSKANVDRHVDDERNNLVFVFAEYVDHYQPDAFLMENVTGITSVDDGTLFETLLSDFRSAGYTVDYQVLNAADYGVPQKRKRMFVQGVQDGSPEWPEPTHAPASEITNTATTFAEVAGDD